MTHPGSRQVPFPGRGVPACSGRSAHPPRWLCIDTGPRSSRRPRRCGRRTARPAGTLPGRSYTLHGDNAHDQLRDVSRTLVNSLIVLKPAKGHTTIVKRFWERVGGRWELKVALRRSRSPSHTSQQIPQAERSGRVKHPLIFSTKLGGYLHVRMDKIMKGNEPQRRRATSRMSLEQRERGERGREAAFPLWSRAQ